MSTLKALSNYHFSSISSKSPTSAVGKVFLEIINQVLYISKIHTKTMDSLLPNQKGSKVVKATKAVCDSMLQKWFNG